MNCTSCRYAAAQAGVDPADEKNPTAKLLECRRMSPAPASVAIVNPAHATLAIWPLVDGDDWCGEFDPKNGGDA